MKYIYFFGRVLFSLLFIVKPIEHFSQGAIDQAAQMGVPMHHVMVPFWGIIALLGGLSILFNYRAKIGAWLIVLFLVPLTFYMHPFWAMEANFEALMHGYCFWKNLALIGAALMISQVGLSPFERKE